MTATSAKDLEVIVDEPADCPECPVVAGRTPGQRVYDMSGHRELLADLAEWAREIRSRPREGAKPWPTSSP
ncbi:hypothetical protein [Amycolatopsis sp. CB00013]|uniref:hypothetical protein n=1 Tax=Amycolatopsis sp. CB00013 TaxID=1703945 RepID=UPI00093AAC20|nr:hypothetical protein [Amycolatopsis sp. CB00013]OKJ98871.1 hypothetical protein AMK34_18940 [Amycolatopsis sp. CB00013]